MTYTIIPKHIICPFWKTEIVLEGKYYYCEEPGHEHEARFSSAQCPIIKNLHQPVQKRIKELSYYAFCRINPCQELHNFEPLIDTRTGKPPIQ